MRCALVAEISSLKNTHLRARLPFLFQRNATVAKCLIIAPDSCMRRANMLAIGMGCDYNTVRPIGHVAADWDSRCAPIDSLALCIDIVVIGIGGHCSLALEINELSGLLQGVN